jgi:hypothetical protein
MASEIGGKKMSKKIIGMIMAGGLCALSLVGCQPKEDKVEPVVEDSTVVIETPVVDETEDVKVSIDDVVVSDVYEWTEEDEITYQAFVKSADQLDLSELKGYVDKRIQDASKMMVDRFVAYYEERLLESQTDMSHIFFEEGVQEALIEVFDYNYITRKALVGIDNQDLADKILPILDMGYKIEQSEGMYYPIVDYTILNTYGDYVTDGVKQYLQLRQRESDIMAYSDAAIIVPWSELGQRLLMAEKILDAPLPESMEASLKETFKWTLMFYTLGTNNTPVFDYEEKRIIDAEIIESFNNMAENGGPIVKDVMTQYLEVLIEEDYNGTDKVYEKINGLLENLLK